MSALFYYTCKSSLNKLIQARREVCGYVCVKVPLSRSHYCLTEAADSSTPVSIVIIHLDVIATESDVVCTKYVRATLYAFVFVYF